ncbi:MAG: helix-turn-helix transcriptional regulator [Alphaproteobacteria bacterium]|nr:helix-turn-helix transcriptional regulator [Alphaproteobacteria bacterium]
MTPQQLIDFRTRMGWTQSELARRLELSPSRISDYEKGQTRSSPPRPAPIPKVVEYALRWLEEHYRPLTSAEKVALWRDTGHLPRHEGPRIDVSRAAIYGPVPRGP